MNEESSIKTLAEELELPVEQVALVWKTCAICDKDFFGCFSLKARNHYVRTVLLELFPE